MARFIEQFSPQLSSMLDEISPQKKVAGVIFVALLIALFVTLGLWASKPDYRPLYTNLSPEDMSGVTNNLSRKKISYKLYANGSSIMVPSDDVYKARLALASEGLPSGGTVGYEIFDRSNIGVTDFAQQLNYIRALQGELMRTINQFAEVEKSRVHVVIPKNTLFLEDKKEPTASVVLKIRNGMKLKESQIKGIVHLVASSVEGLHAENVTVVDTHGKILSGIADSEDALITNSQYEYQQKYERSLEGRIQSMLEKVLGEGKIVARVSAIMDFKKIERTEESYDSESPVVRSEQRTKEKSTGNSLLPSGTPGIASNVPGLGGEAGALQSGNQNQRQTETINYEIGKTVRHVIEPAGEVKKVSVAVLVDGTIEKTEKDGKTEEKYVPRTEEEIGKYKDIVKKIIGFDESRGDQVVVSNVPFHSVNEEIPIEDVSILADYGFWFTVAKHVSGGVFVVFLFLFVLKPLIRWFTKTTEEMTMIKSLPTTVMQLQEGAGGQRGAEGENRNVRNEVLDLVQNSPDRSATVLKSWMSGKE